MLTLNAFRILWAFFSYKALSILNDTATHRTCSFVRTTSYHAFKSASHYSFFDFNRGPLSHDYARLVAQALCKLKVGCSLEWFNKRIESNFMSGANGGRIRYVQTVKWKINRGRPLHENRPISMALLLKNESPRNRSSYCCSLLIMNIFLFHHWRGILIRY